MSLTLTPYLPFAYGADVSIWQDDNSTPQQIDFAKMRSTKAHFVGIKVSQANYLDQDFIYNWNNAKLAGFPRIGYHFLTWDIHGVNQARTFFGAYKNDPPELMAVCDFEKRSGAPGRSAMTNILYDFLEELKRLNDLLDKRKPKEAIYTGASFWKEFGDSRAYWAQYELWLAWYSSKVIPQSIIPAPWKSWLFWQYGTPALGRAMGAESGDIDMNYFNGTPDEFYTFFGLENPNQGEQPQEPEDPQQPTLARLVVDAPTYGLKLRQAAVDGKRLAVMDHGTEVEVLERRQIGADVWARVRLEGWAAEKYGQETYLKGKK